MSSCHPVPPRQVSVLLPALLVLALGAAGCSKPEMPPAPPRPVLSMLVGESGAEDAANTYSGELRSRFETQLAFRVAGKIIERRVDAGATVKSGEVLARLDPADTASSATAAAAQLALAEADARRYRDLRTQNFVSQAALDAKETALKSAQAQAELARNQNAYTTLLADAPGVVAAVAGEVGQVVAAGQTVFRVARPGSMEVAIAVPESRVGSLRIGQPAEVSLWADASARYRGVLRELASVADPATRTFAARVAIADADLPAQDGKRARPLLGMTASVRFPAAAGSLLRVPLTAIFQQDGKPAVWVLAADSTVVLRPVEVAGWGEKDATIASGLAAGERIVVAGVHKLTAGEKVKVAAATVSPAAGNAAQ
ncbi:efflux RND transporter periplasmic adaptor subunit [Rhodocyclus tenuis]|uniref:RND family efflux transporter MFP subunit n=1 Tax=Rhodocyclus tenuis TaxID=1066 RepID=A0A840G5R8_RHOTE|nr:efflux RND transporter periplasmic adaptor subunit [Rhodocyclus tenuis]MBB4246330.1 RND family efflux transporter MFP subunit [Rhodocyclus tenuis]MBK1681880.1 efflux transporter periplasmic adaptor subunit [Rhodocyclus tenuis]